MLCCSKKNKDKSEVDFVSVKEINEKSESVKRAELIAKVESEQFQERLCQAIREDIHSSVQSQISNLQKTMSSKIEASILNTEFVIVNKVIAEVTEHINNRIEKRIIELENRLRDSQILVTKYKTD
jgi:hypothetical protein